MKKTVRALRVVSSVAILAAVFFGLSLQPARAQKVVAWGTNSSGQLNIPLEATNVVAVAAGWSNSMALRMDGTVVCWGSITNVPAEATNVIAIAAGAAHCVALRADGTVVGWGTNAYFLTNYLSSRTGIIAIAAGDFHNLALRADGTVEAWGRNWFGSTIVPSNLSNVVAIAAGPAHSMALKDDGTIVTWGVADTSPYFSTFKTSLRGAHKYRPVAIAAGRANNLAVRADGRVASWSPETPLSVPKSVTNAVAGAAGERHNLALRRDGRVMAWGDGSATNIPASATNVVAIAAGRGHGLAIVSDGSPRVFGSPAYEKQAGVGNRLPLRARVVGREPLTIQWYADGVPIPGQTNDSPTIVAALGTDNVAYHFVASNNLGSVTSAVARVCVIPVTVWGDNNSGQKNVPPDLTNLVAVAAGGFHFLGLKSNGTVAAWGKNADKQATAPVSLTNVIAIAGGADHSIALKSNGVVVAWGRNFDGQTNVPASVTNVISVSAGWAHNLALLRDGRVVAWGNNEFGQTNVPVGLTNVISIAAGYYHNLALKRDGTIISWGNGEDFSVPPSATNIVSIAAGWSHSLALRADGVVIAWGDNTYGQIDVPGSVANVTAIAAGWASSLARRGDGTLISWGKGFYGTTNLPSLSNACDMAMGEHASIAIVREGPPVIHGLLSDSVAHVGDRVVFNPTVVGDQPLSFQWFFNGQPIASGTNNYLILSSVGTNETGAYSLVVSNALGQSASATVTLGVDQSPYFPQLPDTRFAPPWTVMTISSQVQGSMPMVYQWRLNGTNLVDQGRFHGVHSSILEVNTVEYDDSGLYDLIVSNAFGAVTGAVSQVIVSPICVWGDRSADQWNVPTDRRRIVGIASGGDHCLALTEDGNVLAWGGNQYGQNSVPATATNISKIFSAYTHSFAVTSNGNLVAWGDNTYGKCNVPASATNVVKALGSAFGSVAIRQDGTIVTWAFLNPYAGSDYVDLAADSSSYYVLKRDGTVYPPGFSTNRYVSFDVGYNTQRRVGIRTNGNVVDEAFRGEVPVNATNVIAISAGLHHGLALRADRTVLAWGQNYGGQTNIPSNIMNVIAIDAGDTHNLALIDASPLLRIIRQPSPRSALVGEFVELNVIASGQGPISYQWEKNGLEIIGATNSSLVMASAQASDSGSYSVRVSNAVELTISVPATVTVDVLNPSFTVPSINGNQLILSWSSRIGRQYLLQFKSDLNEPIWTDIATNTAVSTTTSVTNTVGTGAGYYRAILVP